MTYPVPIDHIAGRKIIARVHSNLHHCNPGLVLVEVTDVYTYDRRKKASVRALPLASHLREPEVFTHYGVNGSWTVCAASVPIEALHDVATIEDGKVVEWRNKRCETCGERMVRKVVVSERAVEGVPQPPEEDLVFWDCANSCDIPF